MNSPPTRLASPSDVHETRICLGLVLPACPRSTIDWYGYLPASPHRLTTTREGPTRLLDRPFPEGSDRSGFGWLVPLIRQDAHTRVREYQPLSIDYACRPRLRVPTHPGGLACPWNPWYSAGKVLTCLIATHACILPAPPPPDHLWLHRDAGTLPTQLTNRLIAAGLRRCLSPATLSAHITLTSELLRTLSRVVASKPTSWLSS